MVVVAALAMTTGVAVVAPSTARANWVYTTLCLVGKEGAYSIPCYEWYEGGSGTGQRITVSQFEREAQALAGEEANVGATGQTAGSLNYSATSAADAAQVGTDVSAAGAAADGGLLAEASDAGMLPAAGTLGTIPMVAAAAGAGVLGWEIGSQIRDLFIGESNGASTEAKPWIPTAEKMEPTQYLLTTIRETHKLIVPTVGAVVVFGKKLGETTGPTTLEEESGCTGAYSGLNHGWSPNEGNNNFTAPTGARLITTGKYKAGGEYGEHGCEYNDGFYYKGFTAVQLGQGFRGSENKETSAPGAVGPSAAQKKAEEQLQNEGFDTANKPFHKDRKIIGVTAATAFMVTVPSLTEGETYEQYDGKLEGVGLEPEPIALPEGFVNPKLGPEAVVKVEPKPGTSVERQSKVKVRYNPANMPAPSGTGWKPPGLDSIELGPLGIEPCGVFPFGLFCWIGGAFTEMGSGAASCPTFSPHLPSITGGEEKGGVDFCNEPMPAIREVMRPVELFLFVIGLGVLFARGTRVFGPGE